MKTRLRSWCLASTVMTLSIAAFGPVMAQTFPTKPVRFVLPYPPGGPIDLAARAVAERLTSAWGQQVLVDNRVGGNEIVASEIVARSKADGYTLLFGTEAMYLNSYFYSKIPYDPVKDFAPISQVAEANLVLIVKGGLPVTNVAQFVALNKVDPKYFYASSGIGSTLQLAMEELKQEGQFQMTHVAYKGVVPAMQDLLGGQVDALFAAVPAALPYLTAGNIKVLSISGKSRAKALPNVPTFAEQGFPGVRASFILGVWAPAGIDRSIAEKISADIAKVVRDPAFSEKTFNQFGFVASGQTPEAFAAYIRQDSSNAAERIRRLGIKLD
jgi:tripartite-type tricarboxylate transporter receptor subunit TctC